MTKSDPYWKEALEIALDEAGAFNALTKEQIETVAQSLGMASQMESEAKGWLNIPNPMKAELDGAEKHANAEKEKSERNLSLAEAAYARKCGFRPDELYFDYRDGRMEVTERFR